MARIIRFLIRFLIPWTVRGFVWVTEEFIKGLASGSSGFPNAAATMADTLVKRAVAAGFPTRYDKDLYRIMAVFAWADLLVSWVVTSYVTVFLFRMALRVGWAFLLALGSVLL